VKYRNQSASSGVYEIDPDGEGGVSPFKVYCEINSNGGWIKLETAGYLDKQNGESFGCGSRNNVFILSKTEDYSDVDPDTSTSDYYNLGGGGGNYGPQYDGNGNQITQQVSTVDGFCSGDTLDFMGFDDGRVSGDIRYSERPTEWTDMDVDYFTVGGGVGELNESQEEAVQAHIDSVSQRTEMFAQTSDDDGDTNGEVFVKSHDGVQRHLTPWDTGSENSLNDDHDYFYTGETDEDSNHVRQLDSKFILPDKISFYNGGDHSGDSHPISWGYEKGYTLVNDFARSCKEIKNRAPSASSGTYRIDPDGAGGVAPFDVYCEMEQDGGGWIKLRISNHESDRVVTNDHGGSYGFDENCGSYDDVDDKYYRGTDDLSWSKSTNTGEFTYDVDYSSGGNSLSESQEQALRDIAENISAETKSVSLTCDDDGDSKSGHEVTLTDGTGDTFTTTSKTDVSGSGFIGFWVHSTDKAENTFDAIDTSFTGSGPANRSLPQDFIIPAEMTADINSGGAVAWGYEQDYVLMK
jgi:hypothetical protein